MGKSKRMPLKKIAEKENSCENYCHYCGGYYFDDDSNDKDWVKCSEKDYMKHGLDQMEDDWIQSEI